MGYYVLKTDSIKKSLPSFFFSPTPDSLFLLYNEKKQKIFGIYKLKKNNTKRKSFSFYAFKPYRRGLPSHFLEEQKSKIDFNKGPYTELKKSQFLNLAKKLKEINSPQFSSDILQLHLRNNGLEVNLVQNYPKFYFIKKWIKVDEKEINLLYRTLKNSIKNLVHFSNLSFYKEIQSRVHQFLWHKLEYLPLLENRYIGLILDNRLSKIPFELPVWGWKKNVYISRLLPIHEQRHEMILHETKRIQLIFPLYHRLTFNHTKEVESFKKDLNQKEIVERKLSRLDFIHLLEESYIVYYSGHSVYNKYKKEYGLKLNDKDIFYFSQFKQAIKIPKLIIFNSCFDYNYIDQMDNNLISLFECGCKNVVIPFSHIRQKQGPFFISYLDLLQRNYRIGEVHHRLMRENKGKITPLFFRLYGNPMQKYF